MMGEMAGYRRRKVTEPGEDTVFLAVKTTPPKRDRLKEIARARGQSMSEFIVEAVNKFSVDLGTGTVL